MRNGQVTAAAPDAVTPAWLCARGRSWTFRWVLLCPVPACTESARAGLPGFPWTVRPSARAPACMHARTRAVRDAGCGGGRRVLARVRADSNAAATVDRPCAGRKCLWQIRSEKSASASDAPRAVLPGPSPPASTASSIPCEGRAGLGGARGTVEARGAQGRARAGATEQGAHGTAHAGPAQARRRRLGASLTLLHSDIECV